MDVAPIMGLTTPTIIGPWVHVLATSASTQFVPPSTTPFVSATIAIGEVKLESVAHATQRTKNKIKCDNRSTSCCGAKTSQNLGESRGS